MTPRATTKNNFLPSLFQAAVRSSKPRPPLNMGPPTFIKETVFSSEIHSIEYRDSGAGVMSSPVRRNLIYETEIGGAAEVVFDDIEEIGPEENPAGLVPASCDVNVTYDLLQGEFPPPSLGGLSVKIEEDEDLLTQDPLGAAGQSLDNLCLGAEANYGNEIPPLPVLSDKIPDQHNPSSRIIGGITIAEYDGSPRRYRPRGSNETASNASSTSDVSKASGSGIAAAASAASASIPSGMKAVASSAGRPGRPGLRLPGFPQRVLPQAEASAAVANVATTAATATTSSSVNSSPVSLKETQEPKVEVVEEELLKFDDIPSTLTMTTMTPQDAKKSSPMAARVDVGIGAGPVLHRKPLGDDFDLRYEFSETRKVLEEFFQSSNEAMAADDLEKEFNELEYTLRRRSPLSQEQGKTRS